MQLHLERYREHHDRLLAELRARTYWQRAYAALSPSDHTWVLSTGSCESGNDPLKNTGNGYFGAHQWSPSTWSEAVRLFGGGSPASPLDASYSQQAVVAVRWRNYAGASQWPVCGV